MRKYLKIVDLHRAEKGVRFANYIIDLIAFYLLFTVLVVGVVFLFPNRAEIFYQLENINSFVDRIITMLLYAIFMIIMEGLTKGRSIGKYITRTKVIMVDGSEPTWNNYFIRNISRAVPFDQLSFLGENGWHDNWSETRVVNIKRYEAAKRSQNEINTLGATENN